MLSRNESVVPQQALALANSSSAASSAVLARIARSSGRHRRAGRVLDRRIERILGRAPLADEPAQILTRAPAAEEAAA